MQEDILNLGLIGFVIAIMATIILVTNYAQINRKFAFLAYGAILLLNGLWAMYGVLLLIGDIPETKYETSGALISLGVAGLSSVLLLKLVRDSLSYVFPRLRVSAPTPSVASPLNPIGNYGGYNYSIPSIVMFENQTYLMDAPPQTTPFAPSRANPSYSYPPPPQANPYQQTHRSGFDFSAKELLGFDPNSLVHMLALILCVQFFSWTILNFVLAGGTEGLAEDFSESSINIFSLLSTLLPFLIIPVLGVGLFIRRNFNQIIERLGLTIRSFEKFSTSVIVGAVTGFGLVVTIIILSIIIYTILAVFVSEEALNDSEAASDAIAEQINTIWIVLGIAAFAAVGEEIAFRGALQPIFGLWWTAIIFVLIHSQYLLSPSTLILLPVAFTLGLLRRYFDLYACIAAHFSYNFLIGLLALSVGGNLLPF